MQTRAACVSVFVMLWGRSVHAHSMICWLSWSAPTCATQQVSTGIRLLQVMKQLSSIFSALSHCISFFLWTCPTSPSWGTYESSSRLAQSEAENIIEALRLFPSSTWPSFWNFGLPTGKTNKVHSFNRFRGWCERPVILESRGASVPPFVIFTSVFMHENVSDLTLVCVNLPGINSVIWETCKLMCLRLCSAVGLGLVATLTQNYPFSVIWLWGSTQPVTSVWGFVAFT